MHIELPKEVDIIFAKQPSYLGGGGLGPSRPSRYFGLPMVNLGRPPLPPNRPYCQPLNYPKYVKDFDPNVHVKFFKVIIRANGDA
jgi:hypothetical protein